MGWLGGEVLLPADRSGQGLGVLTMGHVVKFVRRLLAGVFAVCGAIADKANSAGGWLAARLSPAQLLVCGFASYCLIGWVLLWLPWSVEAGVEVGALDHLFTVVSAVSTTGLATVATGDSYSFWGELVVLLLFQLGGIGFMTVTSFVILGRGREITTAREGVLKAGFALPTYFDVKRFVRHVVVFSLVIEAAGALVLWREFAAAGVENAGWFAVFHSVSAFATAGFGLRGNSLEDFSDNVTVNVTISSLAYLGAIGFIVMQDVWLSLRFREHMITFTSRVILTMTVGVLVVGSAVVYLAEPALSRLPWDERLMAAVFQVGAASSTSGFNTVPIGGLGAASLAVLICAMVIGASPSGTGGGLKTTGASALWATVVSVMRGRERVTLMGNEIPPARLLIATAAATFYLVCLSLTTLALCLVQPHDLARLVFEAASALGTVGLSTGITGEMTPAGKWVLIIAMFIGRVGPLTLGLALLHRRPRPQPVEVDDLAV
jgi:trk system potassium uptake protein TrkH